MRIPEEDMGPLQRVTGCTELPEPVVDEYWTLRKMVGQCGGLSTAPLGPTLLVMLLRGMGYTCGKDIQPVKVQAGSFRTHERVAIVNGPDNGALGVIDHVLGMGSFAVRLDGPRGEIREYSRFMLAPAPEICGSSVDWSTVEEGRDILILDIKNNAFDATFVKYADGWVYYRKVTATGRSDVKQIEEGSVRLK